MWRAIDGFDANARPQYRHVWAFWSSGVASSIGAHGVFLEECRLRA